MLVLVLQRSSSPGTTRHTLPVTYQHVVSACWHASGHGRTTCTKDLCWKCSKCPTHAPGRPTQEPPRQPHTHSAADYAGQPWPYAVDGGEDVHHTLRLHALEDATQSTERSRPAYRATGREGMIWITYGICIWGGWGECVGVVVGMRGGRIWGEEEKGAEGGEEQKESSLNKATYSAT